MKTIHDQRVYIGTTDSQTLADYLDLYIDNLPNFDSGVDAFIAGPDQTTLKAGEETLAIVLDQRWARELCELLEKFHLREQKYLDEIARLSDEVGALRIEKASGDQAKMQLDINQRLMWNDG